MTDDIFPRPPRRGNHTNVRVACPWCGVECSVWLSETEVPRPGDRESLVAEYCGGSDGDSGCDERFMLRVVAPALVVDAARCDFPEGDQ